MVKLLLARGADPIEADAEPWQLPQLGRKRRATPSSSRSWKLGDLAGMAERGRSKEALHLARQGRKVALFTRLAVSCLARLSSVWFC